MTEQDSVNDIATGLLHDLEVVYGRERPNIGRRKFQYLQPYYAYAQEENIVERIVSAFERLDEDRAIIFRKAVWEAMGRCIANWLGATRTINVATLAYRIERESLTSDMWERLLDRRDPESHKNTAAYLEQLVPLLRGWRVQLAPRKINYKHVLGSIQLRALPSATRWMLQQSRWDVDLSVRIYRAAREKLATHWPELLQARADPQELYDHLFDALLPGVSDDEKVRLLDSYGIASPSQENLSVSYEEALKLYLAAPGGLSEEDLHDDQELTSKVNQVLQQASFI